MAETKRRPQADKEEAARLRRAMERERESDDQKWIRRAIREEIGDVLDDYFAAADDDDDAGAGTGTKDNGQKGAGKGLLESILGPKA